MKADIPVMKAWEQTEARRDEILAYTLFDGTRLGRCRNGRVRMDHPQDMPLILPPSWTKGRIRDHVERTVDVSGTCGMSPADCDAFLKTGRLPGSSRSRHYADLASELSTCTDESRRHAARSRERGGYPYGMYDITTRREARSRAMARFGSHQDGVLQARIVHHMLGSRRGVMGMHRQMVHVLWRRIVDRDIALATLRAYGRKCTVADYNRVAHYWHVRCGPDGTRDRGISTLRHTHRPAFVLRTALFPAKGGPTLAQAIQDVPLRLRELTGDSRLWRSVMTWSDPQLVPLARLLGRMAGRTERHVEPIDADIGRALTMRLAERQPWSPMILQELSWMDTDHIALLIPFLHPLHAAATEARRRGRLRALMASFHLVRDMLVNLHEEDYATLARDARNATWSRLDDRQRQWHRDMIEVRRLEDEADASRPRSWSQDDAWQPLLGTYSDDVGEAIEIVDARGLDQEALDLDHCVDSYAPDCLSGMSRIFSLRTGEHRSTLELRRRSGVWHVQQNFGRENDIPPKQLKTLARSVARAANQAERRSAARGQGRQQ